MYDGQLGDHEISGTWALEEQRGSFQMARANKIWKGIYKQDGEDHEMTIDHLNIFNN